MVGLKNGQVGAARVGWALLHTAAVHGHSCDSVTCASCESAPLKQLAHGSPPGLPPPQRTAPRPPQVVKVFVDNPFPIPLVHHSCGVRCLDVCPARTRLALVDEAGKVVVYDLETKVGGRDGGQRAGVWVLGERCDWPGCGSCSGCAEGAGRGLQMRRLAGWVGGKGRRRPCGCDWRCGLNVKRTHHQPRPRGVSLIAHPVYSPPPPPPPPPGCCV